MPFRAAPRQIRVPRSLRRRTKAQAEASHPTLPRKTPKEPAAARTANRHRWVGRAYRGDRVNHGQGTRQNGPVTSGEGAPRQGERTRSGSPRGPQRPGPSDCLPKTQDGAEGASRRMPSDACPVPEGHGEGLAQAKPRTQAPVNGGRNYNGPKVAKFLVG